MIVKKNNKKNKGFTIIETLIAISILMVSITAPLLLASKGLELSSTAKYQIVAFYLAQDAFEEVKNQIDTNKLKGYSRAENGMLHGDLYDKCTGEDSKCIVDTISSDINKYSNQSLYFHEINGLGYYDNNPNNGEKSKYTRYVNIKILGDTSTSIDSVLVSVIIKWKVPYAGEQKYILKSIVTNW